MIDYNLASQGLEKLLHQIEEQTEIERLTTHATITHLINEMEKVLIDRGGINGDTSEKISFLRLHTAQACGLIDYGHPLSQYIAWCFSSLTILNRILKQCDVDLSFQ